MPLSLIHICVGFHVFIRVAVGLHDAVADFNERSAAVGLDLHIVGDRDGVFRLDEDVYKRQIQANTLYWKTFE